MARKVKLRDTGEDSTSDVAFKAEDGKYYSSEKAYEKLLSISKQDDFTIEFSFRHVNDNDDTDEDMIDIEDFVAINLTSSWPYTT